MKKHTIIMSSLKYIDDDVFEEIKNYTIASTDLYLTIAGTIGDVGEVPEELNGANLTENAAKLTDIICFKKYLMYTLMSSNAQDHFSSKYHQVAQPKLSIETASSTLIPLPPYHEQKRIVNELDRIFNYIDHIELGSNELKEYISNLRATVLYLATTGKLVTHDPNDEPAINLLKQINPSYKSTDNRHYKNVPSGWQFARIKDVFKINPKTHADDVCIAGFVPMSMIDEGFANSFRFEQKKWSSIKSGFTHFQNGDIAVAKISPCLENRKSMILSGLPNGIGAGTTELHIFRSAIVDTKYALYFFKSDYFIKQCVGTFNGVVGQQRVGKSTIEDIIFPLPPLEEQKRIAERVQTIFTKLDRIAVEL